MLSGFPESIFHAKCICGNSDRVCVGCGTPTSGGHASESLRNATVYVSIFGANEEKAQNVIKKLYRLKPEIQREVSRHVILKYTPVLQFVRDTNLEDGDRVLSLIREMEEHE